MNAVYALGSNGSGQLGIGHKEDVSVPKPALFSSPDGPTPEAPSIVRCVAGGNHTLLLTTDGTLYTTGDVATGACGGAPDRQPLVFTPVTLPAPVLLAAATWEATVLVTADENGRGTRVYTSGCGNKGELGLGPLIVRVPAPDLVPDFPPAGAAVVQLSASMGHVVAVLDNGEVYGWGGGRQGQLGASAGVVANPRKIDGVPFRVVQAACGKDFTCLVGEPEKGEILVLGADKWGVRASAPAAVPGWRDVQAGWGNVYVLQADGNLLAWGRNDHGQLPATDLDKLARVAVGSEHVVAVTEARDTVIAWGWGEHGNCGPQVQKDGTQGKWNVIASTKYMPPDASITAIGAGCATSWVMLGQSSS